MASKGFQRRRPGGDGGQTAHKATQKSQSCLVENEVAIINGEPTMQSELLEGIIRLLGTREKVEMEQLH